MAASQPCLPLIQASLVKLGGLVVLPLLMQQRGNVVQNRAHFRMVCPKQPPPDRRRCFVRRNCGVVLLHSLQTPRFFKLHSSPEELHRDCLVSLSILAATPQPRDLHRSDSRRVALLAPPLSPVRVLTSRLTLLHPLQPALLLLNLVAQRGFPPFNREPRVRVIRALPRKADAVL